MGASPVQSLLDRVRRRLWRMQLAAAARWALWGSAGVMLVAAAATLAHRPVRMHDALGAVAVLWIGTIAWASLRRPSESACALWADRHLGGSSAYSTWVETRATATMTSRAEALQWLERWSVAAVPGSLRLLAARREPARLFRPLLAAIAGTALAFLVLTLPGIAPPRTSEDAVPTSRPSLEPGPSEAPTLEPPRLATELRGALQAEKRATARNSGGAAQGAPGEPDAADERRLSSAAIRHRSSTSGTATTSQPARAEGTVDHAATGAQARSGAAASGRAAGDGRDARAEARVSQPLPDMPAVQRREFRPRGKFGEQRSDGDEPGMFVEDGAGSVDANSRLSPPAATPPAAAGTVRMTPAEFAYVQAWLTSSGGRR